MDRNKNEGFSGGGDQSYGSNINTFGSPTLPLPGLPQTGTDQFGNLNSRKTAELNLDVNRNLGIANFGGAKGISPAVIELYQQDLDNGFITEAEFADLTKSVGGEEGSEFGFKEAGITAQAISNLGALFLSGKNIASQNKTAKANRAGNRLDFNNQVAVQQGELNDRAESRRLEGSGLTGATPQLQFLP